MTFLFQAVKFLTFKQSIRPKNIYQTVASLLFFGFITWKMNKTELWY